MIGLGLHHLPPFFKVAPNSDLVVRSLDFIGFGVGKLVFNMIAWVSKLLVENGCGEATKSVCYKAFALLSRTFIPKAAQDLDQGVAGDWLVTFGLRGKNIFSTA